MNKVINFIKESVDEMRTKVSWPSYAELQSSSILVLVASVIFALVIWVIDFSFEKGLGLIYENL